MGSCLKMSPDSACTLRELTFKECLAIEDNFHHFSEKTTVTSSVNLKPRKGQTINLWADLYFG